MEQGAQSIYRTVAVLKAIAERDRYGSGMTEVATATGLTGPTVHRILRALVDVGFALQLEDRNYVLGPLVYDLGLTASSRFDLKGLTGNITTALAEQTGDTVFFSRVSGNDMVCVSRTSGSFPIKTLITDVGLRRPLGVGASGLAVLSALPVDECDAAIERNSALYEELGKTVAQVREEVDIARRAGHVIRDITALGARTISKPLRDKTGRPFGSFSVSSISQRMDGDHLAKCLELLHTAGRKIEEMVRVDYSSHV
ncbi:IclR family transcriptional regulator [Aureimonas fodinaquatilis]|uniref:IclR family transcriptional regulator n=1 Tax=Aureimonas fodinaquatilis TaxID=2565783 RepID=A0A5B0DUU3_9HYPH|nr:IclR family transcriptional regulator [Aureimonas fodinaquatilis]KAA0969772.1 IclR family transcriptional regulator [Aureimonas fodinaquatilis]